MHKQLVVVLLVGLAVSAYGLDLSHAAAKRSAQDEARFLPVPSFIQDFYAQVVYKPLNHVVTQMALLSAQVLAGIATTGLPNPNGRTDYPTEAQLRGFWDGVWNNAVKPQLENTLSGLSLTLAQVLANVGINGINLSIGGRSDLTEAEMRGFTDFLTSLGNTVLDIVKKPVENALQSSALMAAQVLAGIGVNGINLNDLFGTVGKRDLTDAEMRGFSDFLDSFANTVLDIVKKPVENALQSSALMAAQVLAGIGVNGINLSELFGGIGKRDLNDIAARQAELRGFFDTLGNALLNGLQSTWTNVLQGPVQQAIQTTSLMGAQVLAGIGVNGIDLNNLFGSIGKRDLTAEARGPVFDNLLSHATGLFQDQLKPILESGINNAILSLAGVLANFSQGGLGRR